MVASASFTTKLSLQSSKILKPEVKPNRSPQIQKVSTFLCVIFAEVSNKFQDVKDKLQAGIECGAGCPKSNNSLLTTQLWLCPICSFTWSLICGWGYFNRCKWSNLLDVIFTSTSRTCLCYLLLGDWVTPNPGHFRGRHPCRATCFFLRWLFGRVLRFPAPL